VWEFLVFRPLNIVLGSFLIPVVGGWLSLFQGVQLGHQLHIKLAWLIESVAHFEEFVIQCSWELADACDLVKLGRNIALFLKHARSNLGDVHIDKQRIVGVDFKQLIFCQCLSIDPVLNVHVFVWQNHIGVSVLVSWGLEVVHLKILVKFSLIYFEVEVTLGGNLIVSLGG
jgi:hypothetical protein